VEEGLLLSFSCYEGLQGPRLRQACRVPSTAPGSWGRGLSRYPFLQAGERRNAGACAAVPLTSGSGNGAYGSPAPPPAAAALAPLTAGHGQGAAPSRSAGFGLSQLRRELPAANAVLLRSAQPGEAAPTAR